VLDLISIPTTPRNTTRRQWTAGGFSPFLAECRTGVAPHREKWLFSLENLAIRVLAEHLGGGILHIHAY